jgi:hypothetical protein
MLGVVMSPEKETLLPPGHGPSVGGGPPVVNVTDPSVLTRPLMLNDTGAQTVPVTVAKPVMAAEPPLAADWTMVIDPAQVNDFMKPSLRRSTCRVQNWELE